MNITKNLLSFSAFSLLFIATQASAAIYTTTLDLANNNNFSDSPYGNVTLVEDMEGDITFTIGLLGTDTTDQNIEQFGFNLADGATLAQGDFTLPTDWSVNLNGGTMDGFGIFDVTVDYDGGSTGLDPLSFTISAAGDSIATYATVLSVKTNPNFSPSLFSAKISSTGPGAFIGGGTVVPVPAAVWLFGSGLLGLVGVSRRKAR